METLYEDPNFPVMDVSKVDGTVGETNEGVNPNSLVVFLTRKSNSVTKNFTLICYY